MQIQINLVCAAFIIYHHHHHPYFCTKRWQASSIRHIKYKQQQQWHENWDGCFPYLRLLRSQLAGWRNKLEVAIGDARPGYLHRNCDSFVAKGTNLSLILTTEYVFIHETACSMLCNILFVLQCIWGFKGLKSIILPFLTNATNIGAFVSPLPRKVRSASKFDTSI